MYDVAKGRDPNFPEDLRIQPSTCDSVQIAVGGRRKNELISNSHADERDGLLRVEDVAQDVETFGIAGR